MNRTVAIALGAALTSTAWLPATPAQAHAAQVRPADAGPVQIMRVDVDGDRRKDTVTVTQYRGEGYRVRVTTRKKRSSSAVVATESPGAPLYAAAKLDGAKGSELIVTTYDELATGAVVLTWRKNRLVREKAPAMVAVDVTADTGWHWGAGDDSVSGYRFFTRKSRRYVDAFSFEPSSPIIRTRSLWRSGAWRKVGVAQIETDASPDDVARKYGDLKGVKLVRP